MAVVDFEIDKVSVSALGPLLFLFYGAVFQVGYFNALVPEFSSFIGVTDVLFAAAILSGPALLIWPFLGWVAQRWKRDVLSEAPSRFNLDSIVGWILAIPFWILAVVFLGIILINSQLLIILQIVFLFVYYVTSAAFLLINFEWYERERCIDISKFLKFFFFSGLFVFMSGNLYAEHLAGRKCDIRLFDNSIRTVDYLRYVGDGHIFRLGKSVYFYPKDKVQELVCGRNRSSLLKSVETQKIQNIPSVEE